MRVAKRLADREASWKELDQLLTRMEATRKRKRLPENIIRLGQLHRMACADLMLAESYELPGKTTAYLHSLAARAQNLLYPTRAAKFEEWGVALFSSVPKRLRSDWTVRVALLVFFGAFLLAGFAGAASTEFARSLAGDTMIDMSEFMYAQPINALQRNDALMAGFYIQHNTSIGLKCYGFGVFPIVGPIYVLLTQALALGAVFGHMLGVAPDPAPRNFQTFVTAHAPFELTAIALAGAAGLRLGWGLIAPGALTRLAALKRSARESLAVAGVASIFFVIAAFIEGFISASDLPYFAKAGAAVFSTLVILTYILIPGRDWSAPRNRLQLWGRRVIAS